MFHITVLFKVFSLWPLRSLNKRRILLIDAAIIRDRRLVGILLPAAAEFNRINKVIDTRIRTKKIYELSLLCAPEQSNLFTDRLACTDAKRTQLLVQCTISKTTVELLVIACVQPPLPSNKIDFVWGRRRLYAGYPWQTGSLRSKFNKLHPLMPTQPSLHKSCYICAFPGDRSTKGGGGRVVKRSSCRFPLAFASLTSDIGRQHELGHQSYTSDIESDVRCPMSDVWYIRHSILDIRDQISDILNQTLDIGYRTTDIRRRSMDVGRGRQISGMGCILVPELCVLSFLVQNGSLIMFWLGIQIFLNGNHIRSK